ncbi:MAG: hypothetical protein Q7U25_03030 [Sulfuricella sp.]|nr:hypothetical protein [Sulfuricella sp.]
MDITDDHIAASVPGGKVNNAAISTKRNGVFMHLFNMGTSNGQGYFCYGTPDSLTHIGSADRSMVIGQNRNKFNSVEKTLTN